MKFISASEAARLIMSGSNVPVSGSGGGHGVPEAVLEAVEVRFLGEGSPCDLTTLIHVVGIGDRQQKGAARFGHEGMLKRSITSALIDSPILMDPALANRIQSYILPQGVMSQLMREIAGGRPGLIAKTGLPTFIDPRLGGGRQNASSGVSIWPFCRSSRSITKAASTSAASATRSSVSAVSSTSARTPNT